MSDDKELPEIEFVEHIDDSHYLDDLPDGDIDDRRKYSNISKRVLVDRYLSQGWEIVSRNPLTLQRGRLKKRFKGNILIDSE
jgi:hypothetical protein|tara:strand:+ start:492 stop:737 length:246 start_codon:yes stop_codon:yes gene_type:complete